MTHNHTIGNVYDELDVIREAAQLLAKRFSMIADALLDATELFWTLIHEDRVTDWPEQMRTNIAELACELSVGGDTHAYVEQLDSFQSATVIGRILDLRKAMHSHCNQKLV